MKKSESSKKKKLIDFKECTAFLSLSLQQQTFVIRYLKDFNGSQAAIDAKYSKKASRSTASELLTKPNIQKAISEVSKVLFQDENVASVQEIATFLTLIMRGNIRDVASWNEDGLSFSVHEAEDLSQRESRLIKKIKVTEKTSSKGDWTECVTAVELHDPLKAAELLGRYHGMWKDKQEVEHSGDITFTWAK